MSDLAILNLFGFNLMGLVSFFELGIICISLFGIIFYLLVTAESKNYLQKQK